MPSRRLIKRNQRPTLDMLNSPLLISIENISALGSRGTQVPRGLEDRSFMCMPLGQISYQYPPDRKNIIIIYGKSRKMVSNV